MFFDYDPETGIRSDFDYDPETGIAQITQVQDVEPLMERAKLSRNNGLRDHGIKESWFHYASIPMTVALEMRKKGIDVFSGRDIDRVLQEINTNYPYLKFTEKNEGGRVKQHFLLTPCQTSASST
jgi:hypothetical protein